MFLKITKHLTVLLNKKSNKSITKLVFGSQQQLKQIIYK